MKLHPREPVIFAEDFQALVQWYKRVLHFKIKQFFEEDYHFCLLENEAGIQLGIADAKEMGVSLGNRKNNSVVLQFQVANVQAFFTYLTQSGGEITFGPSYDAKDGFWFGGFQDLEGNPFWVVDEDCP